MEEMKLLTKVLLVILSLMILATVAYYVPAPQTWFEASIWQILAIFLPMLAFFVFLSDILINYFPRSFLMGLGLMFIVVLQATGQLNFVTGIVTLLITITLVKTFPKARFKFKLTSAAKINKLRLSGEGEPKRLSRRERRKR